MKTELVHHLKYWTRAEAARDLFAFIEGFYPVDRRGVPTPIGELNR